MLESFQIWNRRWRRPQVRLFWPLQLTRPVFSAQMQAATEARSLRSFEELEHFLVLFANTHEHLSHANPWHGWRAASLARQAGACDHLVSAALVHDFSIRIGCGPVADCGANSAALLVNIFPDQVLAPLRLLDGNCGLPRAEAQRPAGTVSASRAERLCQYVRMAHIQHGHGVLRIRSLLSIARRASLDS